MRDTALSHAHASIAAATNAAPARAGPTAPDGTATSIAPASTSAAAASARRPRCSWNTRRASSIVNGASSVSNNDVVTASVR